VKNYVFRRLYQLGLFPLLLLITTLFVSQVVQIGMTSNIAYAASSHVYPVMNTSETLPDGVWFRTSPHTSDTDRVTGHGVYAGDTVQLTCYAFGDAIGPYANKLWYYVANLTRSTVPQTHALNVGFLNAHYINDGMSANQRDTGVPACSTPRGGSSPYPFPNSIWSGYVATGKQFSDVKAWWQITPIACQPGETSHAYTWIGLGGIGAPLEQIGTASDCIQGQATYRTWWETLPQHKLIVPIAFVHAYEVA